MTQLDCSVTSCLYNQDHYCAKEDITVGDQMRKKQVIPAVRVLRREAAHRVTLPDMRPVP